MTPRALPVAPLPGCTAGKALHPVAAAQFNRRTPVNHSRTLIAISAVLVLLSQNALGRERGLLEKLAIELAQARTPQGSPTSYACPKDKDRLVGTSQGAIRQALGGPDYVEFSPSAWSYFFTRAVPPNQRGGGYPELTFYFGKQKLVTRVTCFYVR